MSDTVPTAVSNLKLISTKQNELTELLASTIERADLALISEQKCKPASRPQQVSDVR
jgi:hypothetical protein